jgi:hypothetical protein
MRNADGESGSKCARERTSVGSGETRTVARKEERSARQSRDDHARVAKRDRPYTLPQNEFSLALNQLA